MYGSGSEKVGEENVPNKGSAHISLQPGDVDMNSLAKALTSLSERECLGIGQAV
jgi:hypothetical protein